MIILGLPLRNVTHRDAESDTSNVSIKEIQCTDSSMEFLKAVTRRGMWSSLCLAHIWFLTVVFSHLLNEHLRCSPSLLPASTAILHRTVGCSAHWACKDCLTSQQHQRAATQPGHRGTAALDGGEMAEDAKNKQNWQRRENSTVHCHCSSFITFEHQE